MRGFGCFIEVNRAATRRRQFLLSSASCLFSLVVFSNECVGEERRAFVAPVHVSIPEFHGSALDRTLAKTVTHCVREGLQRKLALQFIETSYLAGESPHKVPDFGRLERNSVRFLIVGSATFSRAATVAAMSKPDTKHVEFRLWDVTTRKQAMAGRRIERSEDWQQACQSIVDEINKHIAHERLSGPEAETK
jgi:hypothetical protein